MEPRAERRRRLAGLHVLADDDPRWPAGPLAQAEAACAGGAAVVQLRCKHATDREALRLGEAIRAFVVQADDASLTEQDVISACRSRIESYMVPRDVVFVDALPKTTSGKVRKKSLTETVAD